MNARILELPRETAEARRKRTIANMRNALRSLELDLQKIATMGNAEAARAMQNVADRAQHQVVSCAESLADEFRELRDAELEEGSE